MKKNILPFLALCALLVTGCDPNSGQSHQTIPPVTSDIVTTDTSSESSSSEESSSSSSESSSGESSSSSSDSTSESSSEPSSESSSSSSESSSSSSSSSEDVNEYYSNGKFNVSKFYGGYYSSIVSWTDGEDLKTQLHTLINTGYTALPYNGPNYESNIDADHSMFDFEMLDVIYSPENVHYSQTNTAWQREHCYVASRLGYSSTGEATTSPGKGTDFHNLVASSRKGNSSHSDRVFGEADLTSEELTYFGTAEDGYYNDGKIFEPGDKDKGQVARAIFYMATMYDDVTITDDRNTDSHTPQSCLPDLLAWNNFDVSYAEMQHNYSVQNYKYKGVAQGNRNPYVDYPELVEYVYGSKKNNAGTLADLIPAGYELGVYESGIHHYAIKTAKRTYDIGETITNADFTIVAVNNDFTTTPVTDYASVGIANSLAGHTINAEDGKTLTSTVTLGDNSTTYKIDINSYSACSNICQASKTGITNTVIGTPQAITWGGVNWNVTVEATSGYTFQNVTANNGIKMGSGTKAVTKVTFETVSSYLVDAIYVVATAANNSSAYTISTYVGDVKQNEYDCQPNDTVNQTFGTFFTPQEGKIKIEFSGGNAIIISALAFNVVNEE